MTRSQVVEHRYRPRGACAELFRTKDPEVLVAGPAGTGKSRACLEKLHAMMLLTPGARGLIVRKSATSLSATALETFRKFVAKESIDAGDVRYYGGSAQEPASYQYRNGSVVAIGGMDKSSKIMSSEFDVIYVQEATELTEDDWETLTTRLRNWRISFQQLIGDCNPQQPDHWLKRRADAGKTRMLESRHEDNPLLFTDEGQITDQGDHYLHKLDALTGVRYKRLRKGLWVAAEGMIYEEFSSSIHVLSREDLQLFTRGYSLDKDGIPTTWARYWSVDFGFTNPFVCQNWAEDGDGRLYLYREFYSTGKTVDQHARIILGTVRDQRGYWTEPRPRSIFADHDAENRAQFEKEIGQSTEPAHKSVLEGIEAVQKRLRAQADGRPRLYILRDALHSPDPVLVEAKKPTCTLEEIAGYVWENHKTKERPLKKDDHGQDAKRYVVAGVDFGIRVIYRSFTA